MDDGFGRKLVEMLPRLRRFAMSLTGRADRADDLVQATCERALARRDQFEEGTRLDSWLFRIMRNLWIDCRRRSARTGETIDFEAVEQLLGGAASNAEDRATLAVVARVISELPVQMREVLVLVCVEEHSYAEAAEVLGVPIGTVMSRLARARKKVAEALEIKTA